MKYVSLLALLALTVAANARAGVDEVLAKFNAEEKNNCDFDESMNDRKQAAIVAPLNDADGNPTVTLYVINCSRAAYNSAEVIYIEAGGQIQKQYFSAPLTNEKYRVTGFYAFDQLNGTDYDAKTQTLTSFMKGRGIGDAFEAGTYKWIDGNFILVKFVQDNTYDGKINPRTVIDYTKRR